MTYPTIKMKITPAPKLRGKMDVRFPANVEASAPILLDKSGGAYTFSFDANSLSSTFATAAQGALADTAIQSVVAGSNVTVDNTDPRNPVVSASGGGGGGSGDVTGPSSSVDSEIALFSSTTGKVIKRATGSGLAKLTSGVLSAASSGTDYAPATSGTSILKGNGSGGFSSASAGTDFASAEQGALADSAVQSVVAGSNVTVDNTDPRNPVVSASGGGGGGSGDVVGPGSATADRFAAFDGTTGKLIKDSGSSASSFATAAQGTKADSAVQNGANVATITKITQAAYDALSPPVSTTLYVIVG